MPLLETTHTHYVNASVRFTDTTARLVDQYVAFLRAHGQPRATADEVIEQGVGYTFNKDREFQEYLRTPQAKQVASTLRVRKAPAVETASPVPPKSVPAPVAATTAQTKSA
jgi:hypothetical protein